MYNVKRLLKLCAARWSLAAGGQVSASDASAEPENGVDARKFLMRDVFRLSSRVTDMCKTNKGHVAVACAAAFVLSSTLLAQDAAAEVDESPLGIGGGRVELSFGHISDFTRVSSGGLRRTNEYLNAWSVSASIDTEGLFNWNSSQVYIDVLGTSGGDPSGDGVGDVQGINNIEADDTWKVYEAWYEQHVADGKVSLKAGLYDLNTEFDVIETAGLFTHASHGIGPDFSQSGLNGPSIFPTTSLGVRARVQMGTKVHVQAVALDGVPGDPDDSTGTHIHLSSRDGSLIAVEAAYVIADQDSEVAATKIAMGTWRYSEPLREDIAGNPIGARNNQGAYVLAESVLYRESREPSQGIAVFGRYGLADPRLNQLSHYFGAGVVYTGPFPSRGSDQLGLAVAVATNSRNFMESNPEFAKRESAWELTYRMQLFDWLALQPVVQYIVNPGMAPGIDNALVIGLRSEINF